MSFALEDYTNTHITCSAESETPGVQLRDPTSPNYSIESGNVSVVAGDIFTLSGYKLNGIPNTQTPQVPLQFKPMTLFRQGYGTSAPKSGLSSSVAGLRYHTGALPIAVRNYSGELDGFWRFNPTDLSTVDGNGGICQINWGDGTITTYVHQTFLNITVENLRNLEHQYATPGEYEVKIDFIAPETTFVDQHTYTDNYHAVGVPFGDDPFYFMQKEKSFNLGNNTLRPYQGDFGGGSHRITSHLGLGVDTYRVTVSLFNADHWQWTLNEGEDNIVTQGNTADIQANNGSKIEVYAVDSNDQPYGSPSYGYDTVTVYSLTVAEKENGTGNAYYSGRAEQPALTLDEGLPIPKLKPEGGYTYGSTYVFNYPASHPLRFSTTSDGTHAGGDEYTSGVNVNSTTQIQIRVTDETPDVLYYFCSSHSGMGGTLDIG